MSSPLVHLSTTQNITAVNSYASDAAFVSAKGSSASDGDVYLNSTVNAIRARVNSAWVSFTGIPTGQMSDFVGTTAPTGWVLASGLTLGNASSGATGRANADTEELFTLLWNSFANAELAVSTGRGASAAADYAANKTIVIPDLRGRVAVGKDDMGGSTASRITNAEVSIVGTTMGASGGVQSVTLSAAQSGVPAHTHTITDPGHTHNQNSNTRTTNAGANATDGGGGTSHQINNGTLATVSNTTGITGANANSTAAAASSHSSVQPSIILNKIIKL